MSNSLSSPARLSDLIQDLPLDEFAFAPVPVKARHDGWTPARQQGFIHRLALCGDVATAACCVGMSRESAYRLRARPGAESFAAAWDRALRYGDSEVADRALQRAIGGERQSIYWSGRKVGERIVHDTRLLRTLLRAKLRRDEQKAEMKARRRERKKLAKEREAWQRLLSEVRAGHVATEKQGQTRVGV